MTAPPLSRQGNPSLSSGDVSATQSVPQISLKSQSRLDLSTRQTPVLPAKSPAGCTRFGAYTLAPHSSPLSPLGVLLPVLLRSTITKCC